MLDITRSREIEDQLREAQKLEAIGLLTGGLAHDFNNLLGIVVGNLDELGERLPDEEELHARQRAALDAAERSAKITRALLAVARRQPLELGWHDLNGLLGEMMALLRTTTGAAFSLRSQLTAGRLMVRLDAHALSNAVLNLVINARDALQGAPGEPEVMLRTGRARIDAADQHADLALPPGWYAVLEVSDTGKGMSEMVRARAFDPFFTTKEAGKGTGLGLAMVHGFATQLGGTARIRSQAGAGTTVELYLPMDPEAAAADEAAEARRLAALQASAILDTPPEAEFDALVAEIAHACHAPIALVSLVDAHRQWFKAKAGLAAGQTPRGEAFCAHAIVEPAGMLVVRDAQDDPRFSGNPLVTGDPKVRFYAGVALRDAGGEALGTLCVIDHVPRTLSVHQLTQLQMLSQKVAALIRSRGPAGRGSAAAAAANAGADRARSAPRVLVVDDEEALCELAWMWLESLGYVVGIAHSPAQALQRLATEQFDVLFTDIIMPGGIDGRALAVKALELQPGLRVLFASGYVQGLHGEGDLPGPLLSKPYRKQDLAAAFERLAPTLAAPCAT